VCCVFCAVLLQSFNLAVKVPGLPEDTTSLKIRMLPGLLLRQFSVRQTHLLNQSGFSHWVLFCKLVSKNEDF